MTKTKQPDNLLSEADAGEDYESSWTDYDTQDELRMLLDGENKLGSSLNIAEGWGKYL